MVENMVRTLLTERALNSDPKFALVFKYNGARKPLRVLIELLLVFEHCRVLWDVELLAAPTKLHLDTKSLAIKGVTVDGASTRERGRPSSSSRPARR